MARDSDEEAAERHWAVLSDNHQHAAFLVLDALAAGASDILLNGRISSFGEVNLSAQMRLLGKLHDLSEIPEGEGSRIIDGFRLAVGLPPDVEGFVLDGDSAVDHEHHEVFEGRCPIAIPGAGLFSLRVAHSRCRREHMVAIRLQPQPV